MKKKSVITILATVLVYATILPVPAYAALPANASTDIGDIEGYIDNSVYNYWADQCTDELNKIPNPKDRYRHIVELVMTNWNPVKEFLSGPQLVESYMRGEIGGGQASHMVKRMCDNTGIEAMQGGYLQDGYPNETAYVKIDGVVYCYSWAALELWGMDDKYVFIDHNFNGIEIGNPFAPRDQETEVAKSTFYKFTDMVNYVYMHDTDGTLYSVDPAVMSNTLAGTAKFYKCVAGKLIAITEEEAVTLGYVEE